ncbi:MAG: glutamate mutase L [Oscillospiraceae bacterium]|nr:glutamate mutase L [Oscillospiraceae bacterium]
MRDTRVFLDFGSTFTKCAAFDLETETLTARVQTPSTVDTDVTVGLQRALALLAAELPITEREIRGAVACSSAAGGLRLAVCGLVPDYTTKAAHLAALGAGAKVVGVFSYELSAAELAELDALAPDIVLLTGGTDGGDRKNAVHNAHMLARAARVQTVLYAGNKSARDEVAAAFYHSGKTVILAPNVMPDFGALNLDPVNAEIRSLFLTRIMDAKGISRVRGVISGVVMPTPAAVLEAAKLLADGTAAEPGLGELLLTDVGGATTDVYSVARGAPTREGAHLLGLREPYAKRTVEGDLGVYHNLDALSALVPEPGDTRALRERYSVPEGGAMTRYQLLLSRAAVRTAVSRHAGTLERVATSNGEVWVQRGKDLTTVRRVIGSGGPLAFSSDPRFALEGAATPDSPLVLTPSHPEYWLDERYILFAVGLLARAEPDKALRIAKKYLRRI